MSDEARVLLDMATLADVEGEKVRARKLREASDYIVNLEKCVESLEGGSCRYNCRKRKDMWKAGFDWALQKWIATSEISGSVEEEYLKWRKHDDKHECRRG